MSSAVLVTGTAGFIGFHVANALLERGETVIGVDNLLETYYPGWLKQARLEQLHQASNYRHLAIDLADPKAIDQLTPHIEPCASIIHLAAHACVPWSHQHPRLCTHDNVMGLQTLLGLYDAQHVERLIYASSSSVYGRLPDLTPVSENRSLDMPVSPYGSSKIANEVMAQASYALRGAPMIGLRFFKVYGPWARPDTVFFKFADAMFHGRPIELRNFGNIEHSFTYIDDIVNGVLAAHDCRFNETPELHPRYNLGNPNTHSLSGAADLIAEYLGRDVERRLTPLPPGDRSHSRADTSVAAEALCYQPAIGVEEGLRQFVDWYQRDYVRLQQHFANG